MNFAVGIPPNIIHLFSFNLYAASLSQSMVAPYQSVTLSCSVNPLLLNACHDSIDVCSAWLGDRDPALPCVSLRVVTFLVQKIVLVVSNAPSLFPSVSQRRHL